MGLYRRSYNHGCTCGCQDCWSKRTRRPARQMAITGDFDDVAAGEQWHGANSLERFGVQTKGGR